MPCRRRRLGGLLVVALAMVASFLITSPAAAQPEVSTDPPVPTVPQRYLNQVISWTSCSFDAAVKELYPKAPDTNCARFTVPMDWNNPDGHPDIEVAVAHSRATGTSPRA